MKIIELLNKIAKGEKVPKKIKYKNETYIFCNKEYDTNTYYRENDENDLFSDIYANKDDLNDEIEIIEDDKIEEIKIEDNHIIGTWESNGSNYKYTLLSKDVALIEQINKRIRQINEMSDK